MKTAFVWDECYFWHDAGIGALYVPPGGLAEISGSAESPDSKRRVKNLMDRTGLADELERIKPNMATEAQLEYYHTKAHIENVKELSKVGAEAGPFVNVGRGSYEIAAMSAGGAIAGVDAVVKGKAKNAYALTRPPGHHALADTGMGYCIFNNIVIGAEYARKELGLERIMILDWDVHPGNGTEAAFYSDPNVLFVSLHQEKILLPDGCTAEHMGEGAGKGYNINIPLPAGTGNAGYLYALEQIVKPAADNFKPQLILVSAGQDASILDILGRMMVTVEGYKAMTKFVMDLAATHCEGKLVILHEGGYSPEYVPFCTHGIIQTLSGSKIDAEDPFLGPFIGTPYNVLLPDQKARVDAIKELRKSS